MRAKKTILILSIVVIVGISAFALLRHKEPAPAELLKAEQEVYSVVLQSRRSNYSIKINKFQVVEFTSSGELRGNIPADSAGYSIDSSNDFLGLKKETWRDYQRKNKVQYPIQSYLPSTVEVILVDPSGIGVNSGTESTEFYWWISLSRIGFDSSLTQALVLVGDCRGNSCYKSEAVSMYSQGYYIFLKKENGRWLVTEQRRVWRIEAPSP